MARYGMNGRGAVSFTEGLRAGLFDARAARRDEMQMEGMQEDREYLREQRNRQSDEANFNQEINNALREFMGSGGTKYQKAAELLNKFNDSPDQKIGVSRNDDGTFNVGAVDLEGRPIGNPSKLTADDFGKRLYVMSKPEAYFKNVDQKGRYNESERGVLDTATGGFRAHGPGMKGGKQKPVRYPQRGMVLDAGDLIKNDQDLSQLSKEDQDALAFNAAARAQALLAEQPGIDAAAAMSLALEEEAQNITSGEKREHFGFDWLARDVAPTYRDRRKAIGMSGRPANTTSAPADRPIHIQNDDDFNRLPPGSLFTGPDGVLRRKPGAAPGAASPGTVPPPAQRKVGQTFNTPRGLMKWTGTGWMPADAENYFRALRTRPENNGVSDADLRAYINQKFIH